MKWLMSRKSFLILWSCLLLIGMLYVYFLIFFAPIEIVLKSDVDLSPVWEVVSLDSPLYTTGARSELIFDIPGLEFRHNGMQFSLDGGNSFCIEGFFLTDDGKKIYFTDGMIRGVQDRNYLNLSSKEIEFTSKIYKVNSFYFRASRKVFVRKIIWVSYDPRQTKDGMYFPKSLIELKQ